MAGIKISELPAATGSVNTEIFPIVQENVTRKLTVQQLFDDLNDATMTDSTINSTPIGLVDPSTAIFSNLTYPLDGGNIFASTSINPASDMAKTFDVNGAGITITLDAVGTYQSGFWFTLVNTSASHSFTVLATIPDLINGEPDTSVSPYAAISIAKNFDGTSWNIFNNTAGGNADGAFLIDNNLSESTNFPVLRNNIGVNIDFFFDVTNDNVVLTNPCGTWIEIASNDHPISVTFPAMNSTTPGSKSLTDGQPIRFSNYGTSTVQLKYNDGSNIPNGLIQPGDGVWMVVIGNATPNGLINVDYSTLPPLNGGTGVSNPAIHTLPVAQADLNFNFLGPLTDGQLLIGSSGVDPSPNTLTAGTGVSIVNGAGTITINAAGGGMNFVELESSVPLTMVPDTVYFINNSGDTVFTLPTGAPPGSVVGVISDISSDGNFEIHQTALQTISWGPLSTTTGTGGKITSVDPGQTIFLQAAVTTETDELYIVISSTYFNFTVT